MCQLRIKCRDARPVGFLRSTCSRVTGSDLGLQYIWARFAAECLHTFQRGKTTTDQQLVPVRTVLIEQQDRLS
jgi:hypothetical protein